MRHPALLALGLAALLCACGKPTSQDFAPPPAKAAASADASARKATLAYTRQIDIETEAGKVAPIFASARDACDAAAADECVVLDSHLSTGDEPSAKLVLRAAPAGIRRILESLRHAGGVTNESANAEDLAAPIADNERQLAMLHDYRDSLLALRARGGNDINALIRINQELAETQARLEAAAGAQAHMHQRIATETLTINVGAIREAALWAPIAQAGRAFGGNLSAAVAGTITFVAYVIPWGIVLLALGWVLRRLWLRLRRR